MQGNKPWPVAVFAHNEARGIRACLESIMHATSHELECYVLANACTDETERIVLDVAKRHSNVHLVSIDLGDKANAWNVFVHDVAPKGAEVYVFVDGDVRVCANAIALLAQALRDTPHANGASALPSSGRDIERFRAAMIEEKGVAGNLYALRGTFVERIVTQGIKMPIGVIGEDSLVGAMLKWDLRGDVRWDNDRVATVPAACFEFNSMSILNWMEWRKYFRRRVRYSLRGLQNRMLGKAIQPEGFASLPTHVDELYLRYRDSVQFRWHHAKSVFDWFALRYVRKAINRLRQRSTISCL